LGRSDTAVLSKKKRKKRDEVLLPQAERGRSAVHGISSSETSERRPRGEKKKKGSWFRRKQQTTPNKSERKLFPGDDSERQITWYLGKGGLRQSCPRGKKSRRLLGESSRTSKLSKGKHQKKKGGKKKAKVPGEKRNRQSVQRKIKTGNDGPQSNGETVRLFFTGSQEDSAERSSEECADYFRGGEF